MVCGTLRRKVGVPQVFHVGLPVGFFRLPRLGCYTFQHYSRPRCTTVNTPDLTLVTRTREAQP
jgi:hypothetical protein